MTALQHDGPAPYAPPQAIIDLIEGYRDRGYTSPWTPDVLIRAGVTQALVNRTLQALKLLGLLDENHHPTEQFEQLKRARGEEEYKTALQGWLRGVYAEVLQFADPAVDGPERVAEAFRGFTPEGQRARMVTLMMGLFRHAGLIDEIPKRASAAARPKRTAPRAPVSNTVRVYGGSVSPSGAQGATGATGPRGPRGSAGVIGPIALQDDLPPALVGLLRQIPRDGRSWTTDRRRAFLQAFEAVLDFSVPIDDNEDPPSELAFLINPETGERRAL